MLETLQHTEAVKYTFAVFRNGHFWGENVVDDICS